MSVNGKQREGFGAERQGMENLSRVVYGCRARKLQDGCGSLFSDFLLDHILELVKDACFLQFLLGCLEVYGKVDFRVVIFFVYIVFFIFVIFKQIYIKFFRNSGQQFCLQTLL